MEKKRSEDAAKVAAAVLAAGAAAAAGKAGWDRLRSDGGGPHPFKLEEGEGVADGIRGVLAGQVDLAAGHLEGRDGEAPDRAVHEARKSFKRSRAVLRLARRELGPDAFQRENQRYRDLGRDLSGVRDADVLIGTLDAVAEDCAPKLGETPFAALRAHLAADRDAKRARLEHDDSARAGALERLHAAREAIAGLPLEERSAEVLVAGLRRTYKAGRRAAREAARTHDTEALHEWRKRVKDLWHQCQVLEPLWPKRMRAMAAGAHELSDLLGEDHDLAVLADTAAEHSDLVSPEGQTALAAAVAARRQRLQRKAGRVGGKLYRERPRRLAARTLEHAREFLTQVTKARGGGAPVATARSAARTRGTR